MSSWVEWADNLDALERNADAGKPPAADPWDVLILGGRDCPGIAQVNVRAASNLDKQKPKGGKRATVVDNGDPPVELSIKIQLQSNEAQRFRDDFLPILKPPGKRNGRARLEITHPMAEMVGVNVVIIEDISIRHPESGGLMIVELKATEWVAAPKPVKKSGGSGGKVVKEKEWIAVSNAALIERPIPNLPPS